MADAGLSAWRLSLREHFPLDLVSSLRYMLSSSLTFGMPSGAVMEPLPESATPGWPFPFVPQDWKHTPAAVQAYVHTLQDELTQLRDNM